MKSDDYLSADCVFDYLVNKSFIHKKNWKHNTKEKYYDVSFIMAETRASVAVFQVIVDNGKHLVAQSSVRLMQQRFSKDFSAVFINCKI